MMRKFEYIGPGNEMIILPTERVKLTQTGVMIETGNEGALALLESRPDQFREVTVSTKNNSKAKKDGESK